MPISHPPARQENPGIPISVELARHVRAWRMQLDPEVIAELHPGWGHGRRRRRVSQEQVAQLIGCTVQWYAFLELGHLKNYSDDFIKTVTRALRLGADEARLLFLLVGKQPPTPARHATTESLQPVLAAQPFPAYLRDEAWDLLGYNDHLRSAFPWVQHEHPNILRWILTDPDARRQLHRWETDWAPQVLAQVRVEHLRSPDNQRLRQVIREILNANADVRRLWEQPAVFLPAAETRRSILLPEQVEPSPIQVVALEPHGLPLHRLVLLAPAATNAVRASATMPSSTSNVVT